MTNPTDQLAAIADLAAAALTGWPAYEATEAALANSLIPSAGAGTHGGDVADPVAAIAMSHERYYETSAAIAEALGLLRDIQKRMASVRRNHADTHDEIESAVRAARCDGSVDPTCTTLAVKAGLCWKCIKRKQRDDATTGSRTA